MPTISVIMPVYNSKEYLPTAIESVLNQSFTDFELLLIDDGSTDGSEKLCDEFTSKDSRVKALHKENGGICSARNYGISYSSGQYITFIDNDDSYEKDFLKDTYQLMETKKYDFVKTGYEKVQLKSGKISQHFFRSLGKDIILTPQNFCSYYDQLRTSVVFNMVWNGLYKKEFLIENDIHFDESFKWGYDDQDFNCQLFKHFSSCMILAKSYYKWIQREGHSTSLVLSEDVIREKFKLFKIEEDLINTISPSFLHTYEWMQRVSEYVLTLLVAIYKSPTSFCGARNKQIHFLKKSRPSVR